MEILTFITVPSISDVNMGLLIFGGVLLLKLLTLNLFLFAVSTCFDEVSLCNRSLD